MMPPLDVLPASSTAYFYFNTFTSAGASVTASNFAVGDILIYKNGSTTQRTSTSGFTLLDTDGLDFDGTTGIHGFSVDLSDNTDAGFYSVGATYSVIIGPITVNAVTVNFVAGRFRIVPAESVAGYPLVDTQKWLGGTIPAVNVTGVPLVDAKYLLGTIFATPATAGIIDVNLKNIANAAVSTSTAQLGVNVVNNAGAAITAASGVQEVKVQSIATDAITAASIAANAIGASEIADGAIDAATFATGAIDAAALAADAGTEIGTAVWATTTRLLTAGTNIALAKGTGVTGFNDLSAAQVNAEADTALADVGVTTTVTGRIDAAITSRLASGSYTAPLDAAGVRSAVGLASANLDTQLDDLPTNAELATSQAAADDATLAAIAALPSASDNSDAIFDRVLAAGFTFEEIARLIAAVQLGKATGIKSASQAIIRNLEDTADAVTVDFNGSGDRTAVALDAS